MCLLHGLDVTLSSNAGHVKLKLSYHVVNGDCFACCEKSHPFHDRSACPCVAAGFSSSLSITMFVINLLKESLPSVISTEDLLLVVESTGNQAPYKHIVNLHRQVLASLDVFLHLCCRRTECVSNTYDN